LTTSLPQYVGFLWIYPPHSLLNVILLGLLLFFWPTLVQQEDEKTRIGNEGGFVAMNRVNGCLAVSRALGDYEFKKRSDLAAEQQQVSAEPEITGAVCGWCGRCFVAVVHWLCCIVRPSPVLDRLPTDEFIVLCCDGVWDVLTNEECVDQIKKRAETADDVQVMEGLLDRCLELGSRDNMTSCVIRLQPRAPPKYGALSHGLLLCRDLR
jgi:protein phosphatase 1B